MSEEKTNVHSIADLLSNAQQQSAYLIVISAKSAAGIGRMFKLDRSETVLGRSSEAQFQVEDDGISRKHAKVVALGDGRFQLVDLGSTNGTYLNGLRVNTAPLYDGDKIQIGSNTVLKFSIQDQLEEQYQRSIYESATRDGLTRLYNKKYFMETLRKEFAYCLRHRVPLSLVMFDVDHFKKINDVYGHPAGDYVLTRIAQRVSDTVRTEDLLARYGGEEFALMLRESAEDAGAGVRRAVPAGGGPQRLHLQRHADQGDHQPGRGDAAGLGLRAAGGPAGRGGQVPLPGQARGPEPGGRQGRQRPLSPPENR